VYLKFPKWPKPYFSFKKVSGGALVLRITYRKERPSPGSQPVPCRRCPPGRTLSSFNQNVTLELNLFFNGANFGPWSQREPCRRGVQAFRQERKYGPWSSENPSLEYSSPTLKSRINKMGLSNKKIPTYGLSLCCFIYLLKMFANIHFLVRTFLKIAYKRCGFYVRDTEVLPKFEVSSEIEIQGNKNSRQWNDKK